MCSIVHNAIWHMSRQSHCRDMSNISSWSVEYLKNKTIAKFQRISNLIAKKIAGRVPEQTTRFVLNIVIEYTPQRCGRRCGMFRNICMICEIGIFQSKGNANISHCPEIIEILVVPDIVIHLYHVETSISFNILATRWLFCCINKMGGMLFITKCKLLGSISTLNIYMTISNNPIKGKTFE